MNLPMVRDNKPLLIAPMTDDAIDKVYQLEAVTSAQPQVHIPTEHVIHAGMYLRTIRIPAGTLLTGVFIKIPTCLVVSGSVTTFVGDEFRELNGYNVIAASARRKQVFMAHSDVDMTMMFPTDARTVAEAEAQFTDEVDLLMSRHDDLTTTLITGE